MKNLEIIPRKEIEKKDVLRVTRTIYCKRSEYMLTAGNRAQKHFSELATTRPIRGVFFSSNIRRANFSLRAFEHWFNGSVGSSSSSRMPRSFFAVLLLSMAVVVAFVSSPHSQFQPARSQAKYIYIYKFVYTSCLHLCIRYTVKLNFLCLYVIYVCVWYIIFLLNLSHLYVCGGAVQLSAVYKYFHYIQTEPRS